MSILNESFVPTNLKIFPQVGVPAFKHTKFLENSQGSLEVEIGQTRDILSLPLASLRQKFFAAIV